MPDGAPQKRDGRQVGIGQKGILEVDLKKCGMRVVALMRGFKKQEGKHPDTDEHDDCLQKCYGASVHGKRLDQGAST